MKKSKYVLMAALIAVCVLAFTGCMPGDGSNNPAHLAGFFSGIWHGWIAPVSLIVSLFNKNVNIYEAYNNGFMYDLGFYMAVISGFFGLSLTRKKKCK